MFVSNENPREMLGQVGFPPLLQDLMYPSGWFAVPCCAKEARILLEALLMHGQKQTRSIIN